jgi:small subunit ribosomal protein S1
MEKFSEGETVKALVTDVKPDRQRLSLSFREYQRNLQRAELSKYIHHDADESKVTLGDFLKDKGSDSFEQ